jgi:hypothetical protein
MISTTDSSEAAQASLLDPLAPAAEAIAKMPPSIRALYDVILWCARGRCCSTALRFRTILISLYNGHRKWDVSEISNFDDHSREMLCNLLKHAFTGFSDDQIRKACNQLGLHSWFQAGFKRGTIIDRDV